jgi:hypothetical protein
MKKLYSNLHLKPTKGTKLIKDSQLFSWVDPDFTSYGLITKEPATKKGNVEVFEMNTDSTFKEIYALLQGSFDDMVMTQEQVLQFVSEYKDKLSHDWYTFFLLKKDSEFFVAYVFSVGTLGVRVGRFSGDVVWDADRRGRVVVPQLKPSTSHVDPLAPKYFDTLEKRVQKLEETIDKLTKIINI